MLHAIVIEDEKHAVQNLHHVLAEVAPSVVIEATLSSVKEGIEYLSTQPQADIIFSDVQLPDGLSFDIFNKTDVNIPVIFITGYNEFIMNAFEYNGIDYLLKPVNAAELSKALRKYHLLERHFTLQNKTALQKLAQAFNTKQRSRIMVKRGTEHIALRLEDVVLFYTENKIVYVIDKHGRKYLCDKNLTDLEAELDKNVFFRANRQYIVNINFIKGYKGYEKVKLQVDLTLPDLDHCIIISQETAPAFRKWMYEA